MTSLRQVIGAEANDSAGGTLVQSIAAVLASATNLTLAAAQREGGNQFVARNCSELRAALDAAQQLVVAVSRGKLRRHMGARSHQRTCHTRSLRLRQRLPRRSFCMLFWLRVRLCTRLLASWLSLAPSPYLIPLDPAVSVCFIENNRQ